MPALSGAVHAFYLFDVAQAIDLAALERLLGPQAASATLTDKSAGPPRVRYFVPPVVVDAAALGVGSIDGFSVRIKGYDYGVLSLMLSRPFTGDWPAFVALGQDLIESESLERRAAEACAGIVQRVRGALTGIRPSFLSEDYLAFVIHGLDKPSVADQVRPFQADQLRPFQADQLRPFQADQLIDEHGTDIAQLLRGERQPLSRQERDEVLRHRLSYLTDDLVVPAYNAAFVLDTEAGALGVLEILEFVNSQLLEFRYHDELLESELTRTYSDLQKQRWFDRLFGRRPTRAALHLHSVFVDVNELTDRLENSVKLVGDLYSSRLFGLAAARLGLDAWKRNVEEKLKTLDDIYRFAVEQRTSSQANLLELVIVLILVIEFGLLLAGLMK